MKFHYVKFGRPACGARCAPCRRCGCVAHRPRRNKLTCLLCHRQRKSCNRVKPLILKRAISRILQIIPYHILLGFAARHFFSLAFLFSSLTFSEYGQQTLAWWAYKRFWRDLSSFLLFSLHSLSGLKSEIIRIKLRFWLKWSEIGWNLIGFWLGMMWDELKCPEINGCLFWVCSFHKVEKSRDAEG